MLLQIVCVRDSAVGAYGQPNFTVSVGAATRGFSTEVNRADEKNTLYTHPSDFELYHVGSYDDLECSFEIFEKPRLVVRAIDVKK